MQFYGLATPKRSQFRVANLWTEFPASDRFAMAMNVRRCKNPNKTLVAATFEKAKTYIFAELWVWDREVGGSNVFAQVAHQLGSHLQDRSIGGSALSNTQFVLLFPHLLKIQTPFYFLGAPLLFLYIRVLIPKKSALEKKDLLHFMPFSLCVLYMTPYYLQNSAAKLHLISPHYARPWYFVRSGALLLQLWVVRYNPMAPPWSSRTSRPSPRIPFQLAQSTFVHLVIRVADLSTSTMMPFMRLKIARMALALHRVTVLTTACLE